MTDMKYLIQRYQIVYPSGGRDTVNLNPPVLSYDKEVFRMVKKRENPDSVGINLVYTEIRD